LVLHLDHGKVIEFSSVSRIYFLIILIFLSGLVFTGHAVSKVEVVHRLNLAPGNITLSPDHRLFLSLQAFYNPPYKVVEVLEDSTIKPYPSESWNSEAATGESFGKVFGVQVDPLGILWILDGGRPGSVKPRLLGWDTRKESLVRAIELLPPVTREDSFLNDLAVDFLREKAYISDTARGNRSALIVVDLLKRSSRRVLEAHPSVIPRTLDLKIEGRPLRKRLPGGKVITPRLGVNPIALDRENQWVYYGPMHSHSIYRIRAEDLGNAELTKSQLYARVERYGFKPICDGISLDREGNIYFSHLSENAVGVLRPNRKYEILAQDPILLSWPNAFSFGRDGFLYTVSSQIHRSAVLNGGEDVSKPPFHILRLTPLAPGVIGR
jgi:sugar lactone lactonase YvrE